MAQMAWQVPGAFVSQIEPWNEQRLFVICSVNFPGGKKSQFKWHVVWSPCLLRSPRGICTDNMNRNILDKHTYSRDVTWCMTKLGTVHSAVYFNSSSPLTSRLNETFTCLCVMSREYVGLCSYFFCIGVHKFSKNLWVTSKPRRQKGDMKPYHKPYSQIFSATVQNNLVAWDLCTADPL
jgi:hypothetical protein